MRSFTFSCVFFMWSIGFVLCLAVSLSSWSFFWVFLPPPSWHLFHGSILFFFRFSFPHLFLLFLLSCPSLVSPFSHVFLPNDLPFLPFFVFVLSLFSLLMSVLYPILNQPLFLFFPSLSCSILFLFSLLVFLLYLLLCSLSHLLFFLFFVLTFSS